MPSILNLTFTRVNPAIGGVFTDVSELTIYAVSGSAKGESAPAIKIGVAANQRRFLRRKLAKDI
jgi:hypothetical protein